MLQRKIWGYLGVGVLCLSGVLGCEPKDDGAKAKLTAELTECRSQTEKIQSENITLKRQLAQALANPGSIKVDPSLLMVEGKLIEAKPREGTLSQKDVIATLQRNKPDLQRCYERAMKRNSSLHHQQITLNIAFSVQPTGNPTKISISPNYDLEMNDCMSKAIRRWGFPSFQGNPVDVEIPLPLVPRK